MKTKTWLTSATIVLGLALSQTATATFHLAQIEQVAGGVNGDTTAQAVQIRLRISGENIVSGAKLLAFDATGANPITVVDFNTDVANGAAGSRILIATPSFISSTDNTASPDFMMTNPIPAAYLTAGSLAYERDTGEVLWRLSWGGASYTGATTGTVDNDADGEFAPVYGSALPSAGLKALLFQGTTSDPSTNNAADYSVTSGAAVFTNNNGDVFNVTGPTASTPIPTVPSGAPVGGPLGLGVLAAALFAVAALALRRRGAH